MVAKRRKPATKRRKQSGKGVVDVVKKLYSIVKDNKLISRGLGLVPHPGAQLVGNIAGQLGFGMVKPKRKRVTKAKGLSVLVPVTRVVRRRIPNAVRTNQRGAGFFSDLGGGIGNVLGGLGGGIGSLFH